MPKYNVSVRGFEYYPTMEIKAIDKDEAWEKYEEMLANGEILSNNWEYDEPEVEEIK